MVYRCVFSAGLKVWNHGYHHAASLKPSGWQQKMHDDPNLSWRYRRASIWAELIMLITGKKVGYKSNQQSRERAMRWEMSAVITGAIMTDHLQTQRFGSWGSARNVEHISADVGCALLWRGYVRSTSTAVLHKMTFWSTMNVFFYFIVFILFLILHILLAGVK